MLLGREAQIRIQIKSQTEAGTIYGWTEYIYLVSRSATVFIEQLGDSFNRLGDFSEFVCLLNDLSLIISKEELDGLAWSHNRINMLENS
jgi:hypothetical protein